MTCKAISLCWDLSIRVDHRTWMREWRDWETEIQYFSAFQDVIQHYPLQSDVAVRNVVFFTGSSSYTTINAAVTSANTVKTLGKLITVGIQLPNINPLYKIASPNSVVAFNDFNDMSATVDQINQMLMWTEFYIYVFGFSNKGLKLLCPGFRLSIPRSIRIDSLLIESIRPLRPFSLYRI